MYMKKLIFNISILALLLILLLNPQTTLSGSISGLTLWYKAILPSLLPFMIISNFIVQYDLTETISTIMRPLTYILKLDKRAGYCIFAGLFFGFPACATTAISMYNRKHIDAHTANICIMSFNNISPAFLSGYICIAILKNTRYLPVIFGIHYGTILLNSIFVRYIIMKNRPYCDEIYSNTNELNLTDGPVIYGIKNISKLGVYIMLFSILSQYLQKLPIIFTPYLCGIFEITTGINAISESIHNSALLLVIIMPFITFGGICGILQTFAVDTASLIEKRKYLISRLSAIAICSMLSLIFFLM